MISTPDKPGNVEIEKAGNLGPPTAPLCGQIPVAASASEWLQDIARGGAPSLIRGLGSARAGDSF